MARILFFLTASRVIYTFFEFDFSRWCLWQFEVSLSVKARFVTLCGRTRESCEEGWDSVYAGISLMPFLPGKKHAESERKKKNSEFWTFLFVFLIMTAFVLFLQNL